MPDAAGISPTHALWETLRATLAVPDGGSLAVAFSGGLDSRFLAHAARHFGHAPLLLHVSGPHIAPAESAWARRWAHSHNLRLSELELNPLDHQDIAAGGKDRCYYCKHLLFSAMRERLEPGAVLCDGSNFSDLETYRPGLRATRELGIRSPLAEAGLTKDLIRALAGLTGLDRPSQRASPCLLTRFAYGLRPSRDLLGQLAEAEAAVAGLLRLETDSEDEDAIPDFRLRLTRPHVLELHCVSAIPPPLQERIREATAALGLPRPDMIRLPALSGYFDAQTQPDSVRDSS